MRFKRIWMSLVSLAGCVVPLLGQDSLSVKGALNYLLYRLSHEAGKTVFLSTHDLELALQITDRIWLMDKGGGVHIGTPEDLTRDGSLDRFFNLADREKRIKIHFDLNP